MIAYLKMNEIFVIYVIYANVCNLKLLRKLLELMHFGKISGESFSNET